VNNSTLKKLNPCSPNPCKNNGTCIQMSNFYLCSCNQKAGYFGLNCEKEASNNVTDVETTEVLSSVITVIVPEKITLGSKNGVNRIQIGKVKYILLIINYLFKKLN
jgi:hypothetical protein